MWRATLSPRIGCAAHPPFHVHATPMEVEFTPCRVRRCRLTAALVTPDEVFARFRLAYHREEDGNSVLGDYVVDGHFIGDIGDLYETWCAGGFQDGRFGIEGLEIVTDLEREREVIYCTVSTSDKPDIGEPTILTLHPDQLRKPLVRMYTHQWNMNYAHHTSDGEREDGADPETCMWKNPKIWQAFISFKSPHQCSVTVGTSCSISGGIIEGRGVNVELDERFLVLVTESTNSTVTDLWVDKSDPTPFDKDHFQTPTSHAGSSMLWTYVYVTSDLQAALQPGSHRHLDRIFPKTVFNKCSHLAWDELVSTPSG
ncbi:hypothetical protein BJ138DRAFT_1105902 [Hygrophoropsis aurantiaca]|uniref:Uncharacterized protein n=1 Tax=Hygrophoropsis aurantiaca TaxID=72124 RepID=A0ACB7ZWX7_9AGAM|nr:hypothetical protein BJ138DRAFT_1105902 [Hygrophoropsis aurantiaca]